MAKVLRLLNAVTTDTVSASHAVGSTFMDNQVAQALTAQVHCSGITEDIQGSIFLDVSLDGVNWAPFTPGWYYFSGAIPLSFFHEWSGFSDTLLIAASAPDNGGIARPAFRYVRARLEDLSGGNNPQVTVHVALTNTEQLN